MKTNKASIVFAILSVFLFLGCVKELPSPVDGMIFRQYSATISGGTKTEDKGSGKVDWSKGDIIQYWSSDNDRIGTHTVAASGHTEKIKAEVGIDDEYLVAVYGGGAVSDNSASGFILSDAICAEQTGAFKDAHISVAKTEKITSGTLQFRNVTSLIKFSINKTDVRKVVISTNNGEKIHGGGRISVSTKNSSPVASFVDGGGYEISVPVSGPGTFYISTLPITLSKGFTVSLYGTSNHLVGVISRNASLAIRTNTILDLGTLVPITGLSIDKTSLILEKGETESLTAIFYPDDATSKKITWSSNNESVATVDQSGKVTAVKAGSATITVTTTDGGYTATCSVTVKENEPYFVIDGQSNYSVDAGGGEFQFIVKSNVEWTIKDYSDGPYPYQHVTLASDGKIVKVVIDANEGYDARTSYVKFTVPAIQDPVLDETTGEPTGDYADHTERVYFYQEGLTSVSWSSAIPVEMQAGTQLSIAKGAGQYVLYDGANLAMFNPENGDIQFLGPVLGDGTITYSEVLNDDAGNFIMVTPTACGQAFDVYVIPGDTPVDQEVEPTALIHAYFDYYGYGLGHFHARGNVLKDGIVTALIADGPAAGVPVTGAYWEIKDGKATTWAPYGEEKTEDTCQPQYVSFTTGGEIWLANRADFAPLGTSAADGFLYNGYDGTYALQHHVGGITTPLATIGDWANGVTCIKPGFWGEKSIVAINNMAFFPERAMPSVLTIFDATSMAPITSVNILGEGLEGLYMTKPSTCILLEQEGDALVIYSADGAQGLIQKIVVPAK